jgi:hypothetical protein
MLGLVPLASPRRDALAKELSKAALQQRVMLA